METKRTVTFLAEEYQSWTLGHVNNKMLYRGAYCFWFLSVEPFSRYSSDL
jgi:hypothetical protein